ncbi:hypothetical protein SB85_09260 [Xanthomonas sacchari]|nr:hypothetical protein SB85_09260 [Xanthomonas sacchari]
MRRHEVPSHSAPWRSPASPLWCDRRARSEALKWCFRLVAMRCSSVSTPVMGTEVPPRASVGGGGVCSPLALWVRRPSLRRRCAKVVLSDGAMRRD